MKKTKAFSLLEIIIIMIVTAIVSSVATGVIMLNNTTKEISNYSDYSKDAELQDFVEVYNTVISKYYDQVDKKGMLKAAEEAMLNFLGDKYTTYLDDSEYNDILNELSGTYNGIGISIENNIVVKVTPSSPAEKVGIQVNDEIITVNDIDVSNKDSEYIGNLIKQDTNQSVRIKILRNGIEFEFNIQKETLITTTYEVLNNTSIGYISIKNFSENLGDQVETALNYLENLSITSLVIDLRDNVGGYLTAAEDTASLFLENGKTIYSLKNNNTTITYEDKTKENRKYPIVVLINGNSASASEILAAALKESYNAILVGTKSYGKGLVQQVTSLSNGGSIKTTTAKWYTPNGTCIDGIGLSPDYVVEYSKGLNYDTQIEKAIEVLSAIN